MLLGGIIHRLYYAVPPTPELPMATPRMSTRRASDASDDGVLELTWDMFGELCRALAVKVAQSKFSPDLVVGIAKAGVIPGAVIASMLGCDFYSMNISRDTGASRMRRRPRIIQSAPRDAAGKSVLI